MGVRRIHRIGDPVRRVLQRPDRRAPQRLRRFVSNRTQTPEQTPERTGPLPYTQTNMGFRPTTPSVIVGANETPQVSFQRPIGFDYPGRITHLSKMFDVNPALPVRTQIGFRRASERSIVLSSANVLANIALPLDLVQQINAERRQVRAVGFNRTGQLRKPGSSRSAIGFRRAGQRVAPRSAPGPQRRIGFRFGPQSAPPPPPEPNQTP